MESKTVKINKTGDLIYITFPKLLATGLVNHGFSTRLGGASEGIYSSMNMSFNRGDREDAVRENYKRFCDAIGISTDNLVFSKQTHTNNVLSVTEKDRGVGFIKPSFSDIDGLITNSRKVALVTQYADCTPLLFCDPVKRVVASSHSGWQGTLKRIGAVTVEKMVKEYGSKPENIIAAIGPSIGKCCYEVDDRVFYEFKNASFNTDGIFTKKENGKYMLDLKETNRIILTESGIKPSNIDVCDLCTFCNSDYFYSHRKMGVNRGNLAAVIELI